MAVGGNRRGIISSASYEARKLGIYTPMPTASALRLVPNLILVRSHFDRYEWFSRRMFEFIEDLTPWVERTSIDEGYFRLPDGNAQDPLEVARQLQQTIEHRLRVLVAAERAVGDFASRMDDARRRITPSCRCPPCCPIRRRTMSRRIASCRRSCVFGCARWRYRSSEMPIPAPSAPSG